MKNKMAKSHEAVEREGYILVNKKINKLRNIDQQNSLCLKMA